MRPLFLPTLAVLLTLAGCGRQETDSPPEATRAGSAPVAAGAGGAAASTAVAADMCAEHGVLEAICTKCHPKLIAVFQAKGDWCKEHQFPESVCPICHPERGGRPATDVAVDEAPADGTKIRFKTLETAREAGLQIARAIEGPEAGGVAATAVIVPDASKMAVVNARAAGVVRVIKADVGSRVAEGTPLAIIESAAVGEARSRLLAARARASVAEASYLREKGLHEKGISAFKDVQAALQEWETAQGEVAAASGALGMVGATDGAAGAYTLRAPIPGVVTKRTAVLGKLVNEEETLFEIVDTSAMWADIDVPERDAPRVRVGQPVVLRVDGLSDREFHGRISFIAPVVDPQTRTARARAALRNADAVLRANVYAWARIVTDGDRPAVLVPKAAVQEAKGVRLVFVRLAEDEYEARRVRVGAPSGELVAVHSGLKPGEQVVTTGSFMLKTETMKEGIGAGCCEVEAPKK